MISLMRYQKASFIYLNEAFFCISCGRQVEELKSSSQTAAQPNIVINNANSNNNNINSGGFAGRTGQEKNKWVAVLLCFFIGWLGAHRFYEGKIGTGILWLCTGGLMGVEKIIKYNADYLQMEKGNVERPAE